MKRIVTLVALAAIVLTGCNKQQAPRVADNAVVVDSRPVGRLTPDGAPADDATLTKLSDARIDSILGTPVAGDPTVDTVDTTSVTTTHVIATDVTIADPTPPAPPQTHTIRKGDTLWTLAGRYLGSGRRWTEIVDANPGLQAKRLPVGKTIRLPIR